MSSTFDSFVESYEDACERGLAFTGESRDFFARTRIEICAAAIRKSRCAIHSILDYGCGLGHTAPLLLDHFSETRVVGLDNSGPTIAEAQRKYGSSRCRFTTSLDSDENDTFDAAYCNGVFHHIPIAERIDQAKVVFDALRPGGWFMFWENNPWNPGTRYVMSKIPFDRDAILLSPANSRQLLRQVGFHIQTTTYHFFFPRLLRMFRSLERRLVRFPLGGQYCVWAIKPAAA